MLGICMACCLLSCFIFKSVQVYVILNICMRVTTYCHRHDLFCSWQRILFPLQWLKSATWHARRLWMMQSSVYLWLQCGCQGTCSLHEYARSVAATPPNWLNVSKQYEIISLPSEPQEINTSFHSYITCFHAADSSACRWRRKQAC